MREKFHLALLGVLAVTLLSWAALPLRAADFAYEIKVGGSSDASLLFGRLADAEDGVDAKDYPAPPAGVPARTDVEDENIPVDGVINYMYLQGGQGNANPETSKVVGDAFYRLSEDYKSSATNASTWVLVIKDTVGSSVALSWTLSAGMTEPVGGTFQLSDAAGTVKVADLRTTANASLSVGNYYISYRAEGADPAPPTPAPWLDTIAKANGLAKSFVLDFDPAQFSAGNLVVFYYLGDAPVYPDGVTRSSGATLDGNVLTFTMPNDTSSFDSVVINYTLTRTGAGDGAPTATGAIELVLDDIVEIQLLNVAVDGAPADITGDPIKVKVDYTDETKTAYQPITVQYELTGVADALADEPNRYVFTGPAWKGAQADYPWTITFDVTNPVPARAPVTFTETFTEDGGVVTPTYTADVLSQTGQVLTVTLQPTLEAKGNTIDFAIVALEEGQETANVFTTTPVTFQLKGDANLDVDGDGTFDYPDVRLIFNYAGDGSIDNDAMVAGTMYGVERAAEFRQKIADMMESLDIDGDGGFDYPDVRLIFNYAGDGSIDDDSLVAGTIYPVARAEEFRTKISDMIEQ